MEHHLSLAEPIPRIIPILDWAPAPAASACSEAAEPVNPYTPCKKQIVATDFIWYILVITGPSNGLLQNWTNEDLSSVRLS